MYRTFLRFWRTTPCGGCTGPSFNARKKGSIRTNSWSFALQHLGNATEVCLSWWSNGTASNKSASIKATKQSRLLLWVSCTGTHSSTTAGFRHLPTNPDHSWLNTEHETHCLQHFLLGMWPNPLTLLVCLVGCGSWDSATSKVLPGHNLRTIPLLTHHVPALEISSFQREVQKTLRMCLFLPNFSHMWLKPADHIKKGSKRADHEICLGPRATSVRLFQE